MPDNSYYWYGNECVWTTNSWSVTDKTSPRTSNNYTNNKVDVTNVDSLKILFSATFASGESFANYIGVSDNQVLSSTSAFDSFGNADSASLPMVTINLANVSGEKYIIIYATNNDVPAWNYTWTKNTNDMAFHTDYYGNYWRNANYYAIWAE